jgi:uncharacterized protein
MVRIGLISDTHMPQRFKAFPAGIFDLFADVDIILHAGDVGELWVLDELSRIAPVVAVHGNDETPEAENALPYLQTLSIAGHRIVVTHAHYPDRAIELASRTDNWHPHFQRRAEFGRQHQASIVIYGHLHIPMHLEYEGIHLVNPGAIASGNPWTRQLIQTVAILVLEDREPAQVTHFDVNTQAVHHPIFDPAGFAATAHHYSELILEDDLFAVREWLWLSLRPTDDIVLASILKLAHQRWSGETQKKISVRELAMAFQSVSLDPESLHLLAQHPLFASYFE